MLRPTPTPTPTLVGRIPRPLTRLAAPVRAAATPGGGDRDGPSSEAGMPGPGVFDTRPVFATFPPSGDATLFDAR